MAMPFRDGTFDLAYSVGVLHHTPDPERAFGRVAAVVRKGGALAVYVYARYGPSHRFSDAIRRLTTRLPLPVLRAISALAVPAYYLYRVPVISGPLGVVCPISRHPDWRWRWLDTFDWYSPKYQWKLLYPEVFRWFQANGFRDIELFDEPIRMLGSKAASAGGDGVMCGIAGIVKLDPAEAVDETRLKRMRDVLAPPRPRRRGPVDRRAGRARPPAPRDRRRGGRASADGERGRPRRGSSTTARSTTTPSSRPQLEARGHRYRTRSRHRDRSCTSTRRRATAASSGCAACSPSPSGTGPRRRLLLARDRLGIKPLYYAVDGRELLFASEIKAHPRRDGPTRARASTRRCCRSSSPTRFVAGEETFFSGIRKLLPGHTLTWSLGDGLRTRRYWQLPAELDPAARPALEARGARGARAARGRGAEPPHERRAARASSSRGASTRRGSPR